MQDIAPPPVSLTRQQKKRQRHKANQKRKKQEDAAQQQPTLSKEALVDKLTAKKKQHQLQRSGLKVTREVRDKARKLAKSGDLQGAIQLIQEK